jgi:hypothetical protein
VASTDERADRKSPQMGEGVPVYDVCLARP